MITVTVTVKVSVLTASEAKFVSLILLIPLGGPLAWRGEDDHTQHGENK